MDTRKIFLIATLPVGVLFIIAAALYVTSRSTTEKESVPTFVPESLRWERVATSTPWEPRDSGEAFVFQDSLWLMGGLNGNSKVDGENRVEYWTAPHFNDIWRSADGVAWTLVASSSAWTPRRSLSVVEFNGTLWMFGGWSPITGYTNDIWNSGDGIHWSRVVDHAPWVAREGQTVEVFNNKLWLMGGVNYDERQTKNDVWYSDNGITWTEVPDVPWRSRWDHATAVHNGKLFLTGGMNLDKETFKDVWVSDDGVAWSLVTDNAPWEARQGHALESYKGTLWLIGRLNDMESSGANDVWFSEDGIAWKKTTVNPPWAGREDFFATVFKDRLWVFGGMDATWHWRNDVWASGSKEIHEEQAEQVAPLELSAEATLAVIIDGKGDTKPLVEKNKDKRLPIASITKLMTALVASELYSADDVVVITESAIKSKGASGLYTAGDSFLFRDALNALLIGSHNDIAISLAEKVGLDTFVQRMNDKARALRLDDTHFVNVSGLDPEGGGATNYSTAADVAALLQYIFKYKKDMFTVLGKSEYRFTDTSGAREIRVATTNALLKEPTSTLRVLGGKTGETPRAQMNLAIISESPSGGHIVSVVLGSEDSFGDMRALLSHLTESFDW